MLDLGLCFERKSRVQTWRGHRHDHVLLGETSQSLGDDTQAVAQGGVTHGLHRVWPSVSMGCRSGPLVGAPTGRGRSNRKTPAPLRMSVTGVCVFHCLLRQRHRVSSALFVSRLSVVICDFIPQGPLAVSKQKDIVFEVTSN